MHIGGAENEHRPYACKHDRRCIIDIIHGTNDFRV